MAQIFHKIAQSAAGNTIATSSGDTTGCKLLTIVCSEYLTSSSTISDSKGNTWTGRTSKNAGNIACRVYDCINPTVGSGHTFQAAGSGTFPTIIVQGFDDAVSAFDVQNGAATASGVTSQAPGSATPTENNEVVVTGIGSDAVTSSFSVNGGFTISDQGTFGSGTHMGGASAYLIQTTAAAANPSWSWTPSSGAAAVSSTYKTSDTTAPVLSSPTATVTGSTRATVGATTNESNGTLYGVVTGSATQPSVAQIKAGQDHTGAAAAYASSQSISSTGAKTFSATGLTANTTYYAHFVHTDAATNDSNRVTTSSFTTRLVVAVNDANIFYMPEGWYRNGSTYLQSVNPGNYLKLKADASTAFGLTVDVSTLTGGSVSALDYPTIVYQIDDGALTRYQLVSTDAAINLGTGIEITIWFAGMDWDSYDRWNTPVLCLRITGIELTAGRSLVAPTLKTNRFLFYGDSHTEGFEALASGTTVANQDAALAYPYLVGIALDGEYAVAAFAGQGWTVGSGVSSNVPDFEDSWDFHYSGQARITGGVFATTLSGIFICHGHNDGSGVQTAVESTLPQLRTAAPSAPIFCIYPPNLNQAAAILAGEASAGDANSFVFDHGNTNLLTPYASGSHLSGLRGHPRIAAEIIRQYRAAITPSTTGVPGARIFTGV